jgi:hypothetical protein
MFLGKGKGEEKREVRTKRQEFRKSKGGFRRKMKKVASNFRT